MSKALSSKAKAIASSRERARLRTIARRIAAGTKVYYTYRPEVMRPLCDMIASGISAQQASKDLGISQRTFFHWVATSKEARVMYEAARAARADARVEETVVIADESKEAALRIKARQWEASKVQPKVFGDQVDHRHSGTVTLAALLAASYDKHVAPPSEKPAIEQKP